jgi:hypothetical protein
MLMTSDQEENEYDVQEQNECDVDCMVSSVKENKEGYTQRQFDDAK